MELRGINKMKSKIRVREIEDKKIKVKISHPSDRIEEIKREISGCFCAPALDACKTEIFEMWKTDE